MRSTSGEVERGNRSSTAWNHGGGVYAVIAVLGYGNGAPITTFNNASMQLFQTDPIYDQSGTAIGWYYYYYGTGYSGNVDINDFGIKDRVFVK